MQIDKTSYQEKKRQETLRIIQEVIDEMMEDGEVISRGKLVQKTGLSDAVFSKEHVKNLLKTNKVCQYKGYIGGEKRISIEQQLTLENENLLKELKKSSVKISDIMISNERFQKKCEKLESECRMAVEENKLLKGRIHQILTVLDMKGISIDTGWDVIV